MVLIYVDQKFGNGRLAQSQMVFHNGFFKNLILFIFIIIYLSGYYFGSIYNAFWFLFASYFYMILKLSKPKSYIVISVGLTSDKRRVSSLNWLFFIDKCLPAHTGTFDFPTPINIIIIFNS